MKKVLLTSALVAAVASNALAHEKAATVTLGGSIDTQVFSNGEKGAFKQQDFTATTAPSNGKKVHSYGITNDTSLHVKVDGKAHGMGYGALVKLNADTSANKHGDEKVARQTMMYVESKFGRLEAGNYTGSAKALKVSGTSFAVATGGADGDSKHYIHQGFANGGNNASHATSAKVNGKGEFVTSPALATDYDDAKVANSAKVTYFTPSFAGFKAGLTFTPDTAQHGTVNTYHGVDKNFAGGVDTRFSGYKDVFQGGLHYAGKFDKVAVKLSAVGETGKAKKVDATTARHDLRAFEVGANVSYMGFTVGGSYGNLGKSGLYKDMNTTLTTKKVSGKKKSTFWTAGLGYNHGNFGTSLTYFESKSGGFTTTRNAVTGGTDAAAVNYSAKRGEYSIVSLGAEYKVAPGFMPYAEVSHFAMKDKAYDVNTAKQLRKNDGTIVLVGSKLHF